MKKLLNVLYVTHPDSYLSLDGENIVIRIDETTSKRFPLHTIENIVCFNFLGASPALMEFCTNHNIGICFLTPYGKFQARVIGSIHGNVILRKKQYQISEDAKIALPLARSFLLGKIANCRKVLERALRDHAMLVNQEKLQHASLFLKETLTAIPACSSINDLLAFEGSAAKMYFGVFDELILQQKDDFRFLERSRRPPLDPINALLSFFLFFKRMKYLQPLKL
jgi:CRISPR-associated protein Cas1